MKKIILLIVALSVLCEFASAQNQPTGNINPLRVLISDSTVYNDIILNRLDIPVINNALNVNFRSSNILKYPVRIALDPGHVAGNWSEAYLEGHYIENKKNKIRFYESELTMATAYLLKERLEQNGFLVFLTRNWGEGASGKSFTTWYKEDFISCLENDIRNKLVDSSKYRQLLRADRKTVFETYYRIMDLKERAEKINLFNPDITVIIHFNTSEFIAEKGSDAPICAHNYSAFFIPGGFSKSELLSKRQEHDLFRLISTNDVERSARLAASVSKEFEKNLGLKPIELQSSEKWASEIPWLQKYIAPTQYSGVLGRNLYLTRVIQGPLVYGEPFLQNNKEMITLLNKKTLHVRELKVSPMIQTVALSYYNGILGYLKDGNFSVVFE